MCSCMCACVHEGGSVRVPGLGPDPKLRPEHRGPAAPGRVGREQSSHIAHGATLTT